MRFVHRGRHSAALHAPWSGERALGPLTRGRVRGARVALDEMYDEAYDSLVESGDASDADAAAPPENGKRKRAQGPKKRLKPLKRVGYLL